MNQNSKNLFALTCIIAGLAAVSGCSNRSAGTTTTPTTTSTVAQQQQQILNNPNLSPEAKAAASAAYSSYANRSANAKPAQ